MAETNSDNVTEADGLRHSGLVLPDASNTNLTSAVTSIVTSLMTSLRTMLPEAVESITTTTVSTVEEVPAGRRDEQIQPFDFEEEAEIIPNSPPVVNGGDWTTQLFQANMTIVEDEVPDVGSGSMVGVAVGVTIMCIIIATVIAVIVFLVLRRKRRKRREKSIVRIENPRYHDSLARASTLEKSLSTAPTVNFQANNNPMVTFESNNGNSRRKGDAPPIYRPSRPDTSTPIKSAKKGSAPPPPTTNLGSKDSVRVPLNCDMYEKDSAHGSMDNVEHPYNVQSVDNPHSPLAPQPSPSLNSPSSQNSSRPPSAMSPAMINDTNGSSQPLLDISYKPPPPKPPRKSDGSSTNSSLASSRRTLNPPAAPHLAPKEGSDEDEGVEEEAESGGVGGNSSMRTALLGERVKNKNDKTMSSNMSLDSYDRTFNPFFADT